MITKTVNNQKKEKILLEGKSMMIQGEKKERERETEKKIEFNTNFLLYWLRERQFCKNLKQKLPL